MSAIGLLLSGRGVLIVGVEEDPAGLATRVYVNARYEGRYFLVSEPEAREKVRVAWNSTRRHLVADADELRALGPLLAESSA